MIDAISLWCGDGCGCGQTTTVVAVVVVTIASNWRLRVYSRKMEAAWVRQQDRDFDRRHETAKSAFRRFIFYAHSPYCLFGGPTRWSLSRLNGFSIYIYLEKCSIRRWPFLCDCERASGVSNCFFSAALSFVGDGDIFWHMLLSISDDVRANDARAKLKTDAETKQLN